MKLYLIEHKELRYFINKNKNETCINNFDRYKQHGILANEKCESVRPLISVLPVVNPEKNGPQ